MTETTQPLATTPEFQTWLKDLLHANEVRVTFTKTDGSEREMLCTLSEAAIPSDKLPKGTGRTVAETSQRVFDIEKQEWRSFKWDAVKSVTFS